MRFYAMRQVRCRRAVTLTQFIRLGFRGEALSSIGAVAGRLNFTKRHEDRNRRMCNVQRRRNTFF